MDHTSIRHVGRLLEANHYEEMLRVNHVANTIAVMFRRSVIEQLGGFKALYSPAEDYELLLRAARLFSSVHHRTVVAQYRRHPANLSRKGTVMLRAMHRVMERQLPIVNGNPDLKKSMAGRRALLADAFRADRDQAAICSSPPVRDSGSCIEQPLRYSGTFAAVFLSFLGYIDR